MLRNIRFYVMVITGIVAGWVYINGDGNVVRLAQWYALLAAFHLWLALMATPVTRFFPKLPWKGQFIKARRAIGVSSLVYGLMHAYFGFFGELGGFGGMSFWTATIWWGATASTTALVILTCMASTSTEWAIERLGFPRWKMLHRFVYLAAILVLIHALLMGSHFGDLGGNIPMIFLGAAGVLGMFEAVRLGKHINDRAKWWPKWLITLVLVGSMAWVSLNNWGMTEALVYSLSLSVLASVVQRKV